MDSGRERGIRVRIRVRECSLAAESRRVTARVEIADVLDEVRVKEERVDVVLMLGGLRELVLLIRASLECGRNILCKVPRAECGLCEGLLCGENVINHGVRSSERAVHARHDV